MAHATTNDIAKAAKVMGDDRAALAVDDLAAMANERERDALLRALQAMEEANKSNDIVDRAKAARDLARVAVSVGEAHSGDDNAMKALAALSGDKDAGKKLTDAVTAQKTRDSQNKILHPDIFAGADPTAPSPYSNQERQDALKAWHENANKHDKLLDDLTRAISANVTGVKSAAVAPAVAAAPVVAKDEAVPEGLKDTRQPSIPGDRGGDDIASGATASTVAVTSKKFDSIRTESGSVKTLEVQQMLYDMGGHDLGKSGVQKNGVDGDAGKLTWKAINEFRKQQGFSYKDSDHTLHADELAKMREVAGKANEMKAALAGHKRYPDRIPEGANFNTTRGPSIEEQERMQKAYREAVRVGAATGDDLVEPKKTVPSNASVHIKFVQGAKGDGNLSFRDDLDGKQWLKLAALTGQLKPGQTELAISPALAYDMAEKAQIIHDKNPHKAVLKTGVAGKPRYQLSEILAAYQFDKETGELQAIKQEPVNQRTALAMLAKVTGNDDLTKTTGSAKLAVKEFQHKFHIEDTGGVVDSTTMKAIMGEALRIERENAPTPPNLYADPSMKGPAVVRAPEESSYKPPLDTPGIKPSVVREVTVTR